MNAFPKCFGFARVAANHRHVTCKINGWKTPWEYCYWCFDLHVTLFTMHVEIQKEFDIVIQMIMEHVLVQRFKKKDMDEKNNF